MLADLFYKEFWRIRSSDRMSDRDKCAALLEAMYRLFREVTSGEKLMFTTMFARIAYAGHLFKINDDTQRLVHAFRKACREQYTRPANEPYETELELGFVVLSRCIEAVTSVAPPQHVVDFLPTELRYQLAGVRVVKHYPHLRVLATRVEHVARTLFGKIDDEHSTEVAILYDLPDRNEPFTENIFALDRVFNFPVTLHLLDVLVDEKGALRPAGFVVEPDYLIDVTTIAECFKGSDAHPILHLAKKFLPQSTTPAMMLGNVANFFLDELMNDPDADFPSLFRRTFRLNPLAYCLMDDKTVSDLYAKAQTHFLTIRKMVVSEFDSQGLRRENCYLEPSFLAPLFGIQGRLDAFFQHPNQAEAAIVELKSGKAFMPNKHNIGANHYIQTLLYDLMIKAAFVRDLETRNYILYSGADLLPLRFAPVIEAQQYEALQIRNKIVTMERALTRLSEFSLDRPGVLERIAPRNYPEIKGFDAKHLGDFEEAFRHASPLLKKYFKAFASFTSREHLLAKTGAEDSDKSNGLAALWLNDDQTKDDTFSILRNLTLVENQSAAEDALLTFARTSETSTLANFRDGDIGVLYPTEKANFTNLGTQVFKCTVVAIDRQKVTVRLRYKVFNQTLFEQFPVWNIEPDMLDSSFVGQYRGLFSFLKADTSEQKLWLGERAPAVSEVHHVAIPDNMTTEQGEIFRRIVCAEDYFLLWGPPGTGKTSVMLRHLVNYLIHHTDEHILLMAYTNRAVDEICEAIERNGNNIKDLYMRIGSRYGTGEAYHQQLFDHKIAAVKTRAELREVVTKHRIVVATVAGMQSKTELLELIKFDRVIIDEASQILEPSLVGLLPRFPKVVLIGDHRQLPAVVTQPETHSATTDPDLISIGLTNLRNSLFERLFRRCIEQGWHHAFARLSHQGRMHRDIMQFPGLRFYENGLDVLPLGFEYREIQLSPNRFKLHKKASPLQKQLASQRMCFFSTPPDTDSPSGKTNVHEARVVADLVRNYRTLFKESKLALRPESIGIITPFRAQIAQIRNALAEINESEEYLTIDTVERYQGGARDVILFSLCTNRPVHLTTLVSLNDEGVDRKLNVALTRAKHHLAVVGNHELLQNSELYEALITYCRGLTETNTGKS